jgi:hypothetical protein
VGGTDFDAGYCLEGNEGPLCAICAAGRFLDSSTETCIVCPGSGGFPASTFISAPFIGLYVLIGVLVFFKVSERVCLKALDVDGDGDVDTDDIEELFSRTCPTLLKFGRHILGSQKFRILLTLYQIISPMAYNLGIRFPVNMTSVLSSFNFVNFDVLPSLNLACVYPTDYIDSLYFTTLWPIGVSFCQLVVAPMCVAFYTTCREGWTGFCGLFKSLFDGYVTGVSAFVDTFLALTFFIFISTSTAIFRLYKCDYFVDTGESYLEVDYTIDW